MDKKNIRIALVGNPNSGKTTLFNALTGSNQFVGNWPGVTVEKKEGKLKEDDSVIITDLPGIYSLSPYTLEEVVARNYLEGERPDAILNIVDGTNIERNLYLTTQLIELAIPVVVAINMMDVVRKRGDIIHIEALSSAIGCPVVEISALKGDGVEEAAKEAIRVARVGTRFTPTHSFSGPVEHALAHIEEAVVHDYSPEKQRWYAIKIFERDSRVLEQLSIDEKTRSHIEQDILNTERELDDDAESIIINERYLYIARLLSKCYTRKDPDKLSTSDKIDKVLTNRVAALPIFAAIMFLVYYISVSTVGTFVTDWTNDGLFGDGWHLFGIGSAEYETAMNDYAADALWTEEFRATVDAAVNAGITGAVELRETISSGDFAAFDEVYSTYSAELIEYGYDVGTPYDAAFGEEAIGVPEISSYGVWVPGIPVLVESGLEAVNCADWLQALVLDGIVAGVGAVLGFVPQILVLFILLAFLEACGYMSRIAFVLDRIFRKFGLSGKSFIPMLIGTGCGVPGIMASRTIENEHDRRMTVITTTFIPCGAKLPIIALIASAMFGGAWWVAPSAYFIGIAAIVISGIILKKTRLFAGEPAPFVMELPEYHMPTLINVLRSMWERGWSFIKKAGTVILLSTILIWAGSVFGVSNGVFGFYLEGIDYSVLDALGNVIAWIFVPLGFAAPETAVATLMGLVAKEEVVAVLGILDFEGMTPLAAYSFMIFNLLCAPCFAAMGAIRREMNSARWTAFAIGYQCFFAYAISLIVYQFGALIFEGFVGGMQILWLALATFVLVGGLYMLFRPKKNAYNK